MQDPACHLPHRAPFLLVDRVLVREPGVRVVAEKLVAGAGAVPPPLLVEMLAQAAGFLEGESLADRAVFLAGIPEARFAALPVAGDRLLLEVAPEGAFGGFQKIRGAVRRGEEVLCDASLLVKRL